MNPDEPFRSIATVSAVVLFPIMLFFRIRSQLTRERLDRRQEGWFILLTLRPVGLAYIIGFIAYLVNPANMAWSALKLPPGPRWTGVGLAVVAAAFLIWTLSNLGKNLTDTVVTRQAHTLVTTGPYRYVRHPFYLSVLLAALANSLMAANWYLMATGALIFALMFVRTPIEEAKLVARFGDSYRAYMARTGRFWPKRG